MQFSVLLYSFFIYYTFIFICNFHPLKKNTIHLYSTQFFHIFLFSEVIYFHVIASSRFYVRYFSAQKRVRNVWPVRD